MINPRRERPCFIALFALFALFALLCAPGVLVAKCLPDEVAKRDQEIFQHQLRALKDRVSGYQEFKKRYEEMESERLKAAVAQRKLRLEEEKQRDAGREKYIADRIRGLKSHRTAMYQAWQENLQADGHHREQLECAREAFARAHQKFEQMQDEILERTEQREFEVSAHSKHEASSREPHQH